MMLRRTVLAALLSTGALTPAVAVQPSRTEQAVAATSAEPRPALWLLQDDDTKIYMFGTIHILPPGFKWRSRSLDRVISGADELVVETYDPPGDDALDEEMKLIILEKPVPILDRVPQDRRAELAKLIAASKVPPQVFDRMQTWAAGFILGLEQLIGSYGGDPDAAPGVEDVLEDEFRKAGKPIGSVESAADVLRGLNTLSAEVQSELLVAAIDEAGEVAAVDDKDNKLWAAGEAEAMSVDLIEGFPPAVRELLLTKRNAAWTEWLAKRLEKPGTIFFAVGAGHLAGSDSVQNMLAARGLRAERVQ